MNWMELYPRSRRPKIADVENYLSSDCLALYKEFIEFLSGKLNLGYVKPKYLAGRGWAFEFGRSGLIMIKNVVFDNHSFYVNGVEITNREELEKALVLAEEMYNNDFVQRFSEFSAERAEKQKERGLQRRKREKDFVEALRDKIIQGKFNVYRWSPAVSRDKIKRLYESDARGLLNSELLDEVGYTIYARCLQAKEERRLIDLGKLKCHNCSEILSYSPGLITCGCGHQYLYKEYMRSFRKNNMPTDGAEHIFNRFIEDWPKQKSEAEKLRLIDWLIHEFHINLLSGTKGRFVGINLIQGTKAQIQELILNLAYGDNSVVTSDNKRYFQSNL